MNRGEVTRESRAVLPEWGGQASGDKFKLLLRQAVTAVAFSRRLFYSSRLYLRNHRLRAVATTEMAMVMTKP